MYSGTVPFCLSTARRPADGSNGKDAGRAGNGGARRVVTRRAPMSSGALPGGKDGPGHSPMKVWEPDFARNSALMNSRFIRAMNFTWIPFGHAAWHS